MRTGWRAFLQTAALIGVSTALALFAADQIVGHLVLPPPEARAAARAGVAWDRRDRLDVLVDARRTDPNWFPAVPANTYLERPLLVDGRRVIPLGGVAHANVVGCNENGYFSTFTTDEYGFNNPVGSLAAARRPIVFIGDSFTQGDCLRQGATIVDRVRAQRPETINLASGGNGPLFQLAAIREYLQPGKGSVVVWMYYEGNDLEDLRRDRADPLLSRYLEREFAQGLASAQAQINAAVRAMVEARMAERLEGRAVLLPNLRELIWQARRRQSSPRTAVAANGTGKDDEANVALFHKVLTRARDDVGERGGKLLFVYLPEYYRYAGPKPSTDASQRDRVLSGVRARGIPVVDLDEAFRRHPDPATLFPFGLKGHYNAKGAEVAAQFLLDALAD
jgi:hypothetical protein